MPFLTMQISPQIPQSHSELRLKIISINEYLLVPRPRFQCSAGYVAAHFEIDIYLAASILNSAKSRFNSHESSGIKTYLIHQSELVSVPAPAFQLQVNFL
jgi:hypothetical protein